LAGSDLWCTIPPGGPDRGAAGGPAGYTIVNDLTTRDRIYRRDMPKIGTDWFRGRHAPGFLPTGPWVPADLVGDPQDRRITLTLNGDVMQNESTEDMIFGVEALVSAASHVVALLPARRPARPPAAGRGRHGVDDHRARRAAGPVRRPGGRPMSAVEAVLVVGVGGGRRSAPAPRGAGAR
jgi:hypothetical protein